MKLPRIKTRMANILAKLAGSKDYDPNVRPLTPAEYYADKIPVIPSPAGASEGMSLVTDGKGGYTLGQGSGGGTNVLTLYGKKNNDAGVAYKNPECTDTYQTFIEAYNAINNADIIKIVDKDSPETISIIYNAIGKVAGVDASVDVSTIGPLSNTILVFNLWCNDIT